MMFKSIAPKGIHAAYRQIIAPDGTPVLGVYTGEYLPRMGGLRESSVYIIEENGEENDCIICEFGGVIRDLLNYLNSKDYKLEENFTLSSGGWNKLDKIKFAPSSK